MESNLKIAIVGFGFVGKAVSYGFTHKKVRQYLVDPLLGKDISSLDKVNPDIAFVCVPTPMSDTGEIDSTLVVNTVKYLVENTPALVVIKSTITPTVLRQIKMRLSHPGNMDRVVYNPEFLTENNANSDFANPDLQVFGGNIVSCEQAAAAYNAYSICGPCPTFFVTHEEASFIKYGINCYLASKVLWFNQFSDIVEASGSSYENVAAAMQADFRIGTSHMMVPGPDGKKGFGGACFAKDTAAFSHYSNQYFTVLDEVIARNNEIRLQYPLDPREIAQSVTYKGK
jgi:UDPglucose 6-dehydrogenase